MNLIYLTLYNIKRYLKNPLVIIMNFVLIIIMLFAVCNSSSAKGSIGVINNDKSGYSKQLIKEMKKEFDVKIYSGEAKDNYNELIDNEIGALYVIDDNIEECIKNNKAPKIKSYILESSSGMVLANNIIDKYFAKKIQENISGIDTSNYIETIIKSDDSKSFDKFILVIILVCYIMLISNTVISEDIIALKTQKVLRRAISTGNKDRVILGSMYLASFIIQSVSYILALLIILPFIDLDVFYLGRTILSLLLMALISTSIVVLSSRYLKKSGLTSIINVVYGLISFVLAVITLELDSFSNIPDEFKSITVLSPLTWVVNILKFEDVIKSVIILLLMSIVFFTAGSFRLRDYVKD